MPAQDLWDTVQKLAPLSPVRYQFRLHGWKGAPWHVLRLELVEALNLPYQLTLELVVDEPRIDLDDLLGDSCTGELDRDGGDARSVHGLVLSADDLGRVAGRHHIRLEVGPALALLGQSVDTRAWQDSTAVDVLRGVLTPELARDHRSVVLSHLGAADYPRRDYCVQFRESNLAFISRLLEEEGITAYFDHDGPSERLVLVDDNRDFPALQPAPLELVETEPDTAPGESLQRFTGGRRLRSTSVDQRNFDWQSPDSPRSAARAGVDLRGRSREIYEHDDIVYPGDGPRHAKIKQERLAVGGHMASGSSNVTRLAPGLWFTLQGHARGDLDDRYLVTRVVHRGHSPDAAIFQQQQSPGPRYANEFECIPLKVPHRPAQRHVKPRVSGLQTAIVTGPPGEEVHCDEHGRIKILPHWDRLSPRDDTSSVWIRVAQSVAGGSWGMFALPRIGQEVVVDFLDGDPDRPLVVGCVYNGSNAPPYPLPAEKTKTTIKSNSSPGGGGSNELRFEDLAGGEEVFLHAQKDWNSVVEADKTLRVGGSESDSVGGSRSVSVGGGDSLSVGGSRSMSVGGSLTETVGAAHTLTVGAAQTNTIGAAQTNSITGPRTSTVIGPDTVTVIGGRTEDINTADTKTVTGNETTTISGTKTEQTAMTLETVAGMKLLSAGDNILLVNGSQISLISAAHLEMVTTKLLAASAGIGLMSGGTQVVIVPGKVTIDGAGEVVINGGGTITLNGGGTINLNGEGTLNIDGGGTVNIAGDSAVNVTGGTIKLNC